MTSRSGLGFGLYFGVFFFTNGLMFAYWPVWLSDRGLDATAIGVLLFSVQWIKVAGTLVSGDMADRFGIARRLVIALSAAGACVMFLFGQASGFWQLLALTLLWGAAWSAILPIVDGQAMQASSRGAFDYGRTRMWGSITFIAATIGGGYLLQASGSTAVQQVILAAATCTAVAALALPIGRTPREFLARGRGAMFDLLRDRAFCLFLLAGGAVQVSHAVYYGFATIDWRARGLDDRAIGLLWAFAVLAEIVLFALGRRLADRIGVLRLLAIAGVAAMLRWAMTPLLDEFLLLAAVQTLHALTFGAAHLGAMMFIQQRVPSGAVSSAQALYAALPIGFGMGLAMIGAGVLYQKFAGYAYFAMVALAAFSLVACWLLAKCQQAPATGVSASGRGT